MLAAIAVFLLAALPAHAQLPAPAEAPAGITPERAAPAEPVPEPGINQPAPRQPAIPEGADEARFFLADIVVEGATAYPESELRPLYNAFLQSEISLATLYGIASAIETKYREDGYVVSRAIVPAQSVSDGVYRIKVIEGFIDSVIVEGDIGASREIVERYLNRIPGSSPVNIADIERYLLLVNDLPGISGTGVLRPADASVGAATLVVTVQRESFTGFGLFDNRGSEFTGPLGLALGASGNSFTRFGEQTEVILFSALEDSEQLVGQITYQQQIGSDGIYIRGLASYGESQPGAGLKPLEIDQKTSYFAIESFYPYIRSRRLNLGITAGFDFVDQETRIFSGASQLADDSLRVLWAKLTFDNRDTYNGANFVDFGVRQGLPILGASEAGDNTSRIDADGSFTSFRGEGARLQRIIPSLNLLARVGGQLAFEPLLSTEEFKLGNLTFGRGYVPSELTGDSGLGTTLELQFNQAPGFSVLQSYQLYAFWDFGFVVNEDPSVKRYADLASAGLGIRTNVNNYFSVDLEVAKPLTRPLANRQDNRKDPRFFFRLTGQF